MMPVRPRLHIIGKHPLFSVHIHHFEVDAGPSFGQLTTLGQLFFQNLTLFFQNLDLLLETLYGE